MKTGRWRQFLVVSVLVGLMAESMSIETEYGFRFILRGDERVSPSGVTQQCEVPAAVSALRSRGRQELPAALLRARMR